MKLIILLLTALPGLAQITFSLTNSNDCQTQGCQSVMIDGDTMFSSGWANSGTFIYNGVTINGAVYGTFNDGSATGCSGSSNVGVQKLNGIDFTTPANGSYSLVNCMSSFGTGGSIAWAPAADGTCSTTHTNGCSWKSAGLTIVSDKMYLAVFRQDNGTSAGQDSTFMISSDLGATWLNPAHIGGTPSATGDMPPGPGGSDYTASVLFKAGGQNSNGSQTYTARMSFVNYCKDETISCPTVDDNATYTYIISESGNYANYIIGRWPKSSMPTLDVSTIQWYKCATYPSPVCDGSLSGSWDTLANSTKFSISTQIVGAMFHAVWDAGKNLYVGVGFDGNNGDIYLSTAPHVWGPWTLGHTVNPNPTCTISGCSVFDSITLATLTDVNSTTTTFAVNTDSIGHSASGTAYHYKFTMTVPSAVAGSVVSMRGKASISGKTTLGVQVTGIAVAVVGQSNTQAILSYTAPSTSTCTVEVSESASYTPVVNDVNSVLFTGAASDSRDGSLGVGTTSRVVVVGKRTTDLALNGNRYSRALQAYTTHYARINCDGYVGTASFTTSNIPGGMTYQDLPKSGGGVWLMPTVTADDRSQTIIDQFTGAKLRAVTAKSDRQNSSVDGYNMAFGGFVRVCTAGAQTSPLDGAGYVCQIFHNQAEGTSIYFINPTTGVVRNLGFITNTGHATVASDLTWIECPDTGIGCFQANKWQYTGDWTEQHNATKTMLSVYGTTSLGAQLALFSGSFDITAFPCTTTVPFANVGEYKQYPCGPAGGSGQDGYAWVAIYGGTENAIVAAYNPMLNSVSRFCGNHNNQVMQNFPTNPTVQVMELNWKGDLNNNSARDSAAWTSTLFNNITSSQLTFDLTGAPVSGYSGGDTLAMGNWQVGDVFNLGGETLTITAASGTSPRTVTVASRSGGSSHSAGDSVRELCKATHPGGLTYWRFLVDPHGTATAAPNMIVDQFIDSGGHTEMGLFGRNTEGWPTWPGDITTNLNTAIMLDITDSPPFHGKVTPAFGSATTKHPSAHQTLATPAGVERAWFYDQVILNGADLFFGDVNAVSQGGSLYKYSAPSDPTWSPPYSQGLWRKLFPTFAFTGGTPYTDISGPSSSIGTASGDNWKYCVVRVANECRSGSVVGEIYFNTGATLTTLHCTTSDSPQPQRLDVCIGPSPAHADSIPQLLSTATDVTNATRRSRVLAHATLFGPRNMIAFPFAKQLPGAEWGLFNGGPGQCSTTVDARFCNIWMVKNPPFPAQDSYDRSDFIPINTGTITGGGSITNAVVKFGYLEFGTATDFYCTSRAEACYANNATVPTGIDPFNYPTDGSSNTLATLTGVTCTSTCNIDIPALSGHVLYYQIILRGSGNSIISTGATQVVVIP